MASFFTTGGLEYILQSALAAKTLKLATIDTGTHTPAITDEFLSDVTTGGIVGTSAALTAITYTGGVLDAADGNVTALTGNSVETGALYVDTGVAATSPILCYCEFTAAVTPTGADAAIRFAATGIGTLAAAAA